MPRQWLAVIASISLVACQKDAAPKVLTTLRPGEMARVGDKAISRDIVLSVARSRRISPRAALDALVEDVLLAKRAETERADQDTSVHFALTTLLARSSANRIAQSARALGPPTDDELATLTVVHAVVLRSTILSDEAGQNIAGAVERAVSAAPSPDDFEKRASAVAHSGARVVVERIANFGADGRLPDGRGLDPAFVAAAFALRAPGETSPVAETTFGWHVVRLISRQTPEASLRDQREADLSDAVFALRGRIQLSALLRLRREHVRVEVAGGAESLMASINADAIE